MKIYDRKTGALLALENAKRQFKSAELIAKDGNFGLAVSLMILSAEETLKGYVLFASKLLPDSSEIDDNMLFNYHDYKLELIREIVFFGQIVDIFNENILEPIINNLKKTKEERNKIHNNGINEILRWMEKETTSKQTELSLNLDWWNQANSIKKEGFYVSYRKQGWHTPDHISKKQYIKTRTYVKNFIDRVEVVISIEIEQEPIKSLIDGMKIKYNKFKKKNDNKI